MRRTKCLTLSEILAPDVLQTYLVLRPRALLVISASCFGPDDRALAISVYLMFIIPSCPSFCQQHSPRPAC